MKLNTSSLKRSLILGLGLLTVSIAVAMLLIGLLVRNRLIEDSADKTQELADMIQTNIRTLMLKRDPSAIQDIMDQVGRKQGDSIIRAFILNKASKIVYSSDRKRIGEVLNRFAEPSCDGCHKKIDSAPSNHTLIIDVDGVKAQRNVKVIFNEKACHGCHAPSDRINGKLIIDRSLQRTDSLIVSVELIIFGSGGICLMIVVPFLRRKIDHLIAELQQALATIKTLQEILPICSYCKKIRDEQGAWKHPETYISEHTDTQFSHGLCPDCAKKKYPQYFKES